MVANQHWRLTMSWTGKPYSLASTTSSNAVRTKDKASIWTRTSRLCCMLPPVSVSMETKIFADTPIARSEFLSLLFSSAAAAVAVAAAAVGSFRPIVTVLFSWWGRSTRVRSNSSGWIIVSRLWIRRSLRSIRTSAKRPPISIVVSTSKSGSSPPLGPSTKDVVGVVVVVLVVWLSLFPFSAPLSWPMASMIIGRISTSLILGNPVSGLFASRFSSKRLVVSMAGSPFSKKDRKSMSPCFLLLLLLLLLVVEVMPSVGWSSIPFG
mmetsp:Transcript_27589/g.60863  ORF Transcript_27589/g.60863 Transcript_27589/m.60863 type:complete len:265 (-) Transcript_27589:144-938(-)